MIISLRIFSVAFSGMPNRIRTWPAPESAPAGQSMQQLRCRGPACLYWKGEPREAGQGSRIGL